MEELTKYKVGVGVFVMLSVIMAAGLIGEDSVYYCEDKQIAMICDKLSKPNVDGLSTRCYYFSEELNRSTYKMCTKTGWFEFVNNQNTYSYNDTDFVCDKGQLIKECKADDGQIILRIKNDGIKN